jgi:putative hemolysin
MMATGTAALHAEERDGQAGRDHRTLEARLARDTSEVEAAQRLRYRVFYEEMTATPSAAMRTARRDFDRFDAICDHLLVLDGQLGDGPEAIVGTYRLLRGEVADRHGGFYTESEFDLGALSGARARTLELGRACVDMRYRTRATMQRLWSGIADYVFGHDVAIMLGCASLPGTDPEALAPALSYLHHRHLAPPELRPRALPGRFERMDLLPPERFAESDAMAALDARAVVAGLPPLVKGYLRLGGFVGDGAVVDQQFGTTDVCVVVAVDRVTDKYFNHYRRKLGRG